MDIKINIAKRLKISESTAYKYRYPCGGILPKMLKILYEDT